MSQPVRAGLIGTGSIAQSAHIPAWSTVDDVDIVAIADIDEAALSTAETQLRDHGQPDVSTYTDYETMLAEVAPDVVDITIPAGETKRAAIRAGLDAGCHVTCQKPFVRDLDAARRLAAHAARVDRILSVNHQARFAGAFSKAASLIDDGDVGSIRTVRLSSDLQLAGHDRWLRFSIHNFDLLRHWLGREPSRVLGWHRKQTGDDRHVFATWLDFGDVMAQVWDELSSSTSLRWQFRIGGAEGTVRGHEAYFPEMLAPEVVYTPAGAVTETVMPISSRYVPDAFVRYFERFVDAVRGSHPPPVPADDNVHSLRVALAAGRSAERGEWIEIDEFTA